MKKILAFILGAALLAGCGTMQSGGVSKCGNSASNAHWFIRIL